MRFFRASWVKDVRRRLADLPALFLWLGIPAAIGGLMALVAGGGGPPTARVWLVDQDDSFLSGLLAGAGAQSGGDRFVEIEKVELAEGQARIADGEGTALLILPDGFSDAVLEGTPAEITLVTNPAQRILPAIVQEGLEIFVEGAFYLQRLLGDELSVLTEGPPAPDRFFENATVGALSADINERMRALDGVVFPPVLTVEEEIETEDATAGLNFGTLFLPGILFMSLLFIAQGLSDDVWEEKEKGTLRRVRTTPGGVGAFLAGKLASGTALVALVSVVGLAIASAFFGVALARWPLALLWCTFAGTALLVYFFWIQTLGTSRRGASLLATILIFPLMMLGGSFFPFETMPAWMAAVGRWTPNGLAVVRLKEMLLGRPEAVPLLVSALGIGLPALVAFAVCARRLRGRFALP